MPPEEDGPWLGAPEPVLTPLWWAEVAADGELCVGRVGDLWSPTPGSQWWDNYHADTESEARDQAIAAMGKELADQRAVIGLTWTRMGEASARWRAEDPAARARTMPDLGDLLAWLMADADRARNELAGIRAAGVDPGLLRWCVWPGCLASFNAATGPEGGGWIRYRHMSVLLCPDHKGTGHWPSYDLDRDDLSNLHAQCGCGDTAEVRPSNHQAVFAWWEQHLADLGLTAAAGTGGGTR